MGTTQKDLILALRKQGASYKDIATRLGVLETYARTICSRANRKQETYPAGQCKECGAELSYIAGSKPKQFCSDACRYKWNNRLKQCRPYICYCEQCGAEFVSYGFPGKRFCSRECQTMARLKGKR